MARAKEVFGSHANLAHTWASGEYERGRSGDGRMLFSGATIYSYRESWPMAVLFIDRNGVQQVLINGDSYSVSTSKHQGLVQGAVTHLPAIARLSLDSVKDFSYMVRANGKDLRQWPDVALARLASFWNDFVEGFRRHIVAEESRADRARKNGPWIREGLGRDIERAIALGAAFGFSNVSFGDLEALRAQITAEKAEQDERNRIENERRAKIAKERRLELESTSLISDWYAGSNDGVMLGSARVYIQAYDCRTLLRRSKDGETVETSRGASVPWLDALKLYTFAKRVEGKGYAPPPDVACGPYRLTSISKAGDVKIGCHDLLMVEMQALAEREGVAL
jgi:hypothetical protein